MDIWFDNILTLPLRVMVRTERPSRKRQVSMVRRHASKAGLVQVDALIMSS